MLSACLCLLLCCCLSAVLSAKAAMSDFMLFLYESANQAARHRPTHHCYCRSGRVLPTAVCSLAACSVLAVRCCVFVCAQRLLRQRVLLSHLALQHVSDSTPCSRYNTQHSTRGRGVALLSNCLSISVRLCVCVCCVQRLATGLSTTFPLPSQRSVAAMSAPLPSANS